MDLFYGYVREDVPFVNQLSDSNENVVIIAPTNEAISHLNKKPWEFPRNIEALEAAGSSDQEIDEAIRDNILEFVGSHVVVYNDEDAFEKQVDDYTVVRSAALNGSQESDSGDIFVKREGDSFFVASSKDKVFHEVKSFEKGINGVVLVVDSCLSWPDF